MTSVSRSLHATPADDILVFGGSASQPLAHGICAELGIPLGKGEVLHFSEGNLFVRILQNVRGKHIYLVQSTGFPANDNFMELLFWIDAFCRASAASVTAIVPYFSYAKGDKKDEPRVSIRARVCADAIEAAGVSRVVVMDLHSPQIQGFFKVPVDDLYALPILCAAVEAKQLGDLVVVSPDSGFAKKARKFASRLGTSLAIADKERRDHDERAQIHGIIGDVRGKTALLVDDFTISAGTLAAAAERLIEAGAHAVYAAVSHGVFGPGAMKRLDDSPIIQLLVTDSVELPTGERSAKLETVSTAPLFAEAIRRIHGHESVSALFET